MVRIDTADPDPTRSQPSGLGLLFLTLCVCCTTLCGCAPAGPDEASGKSASDQQPIRFVEDREAQAELSRIRGQIQSSRQKRADMETLAALRKLYDRYPDADEVFDTYKDELNKYEDWATLIAVYRPRVERMDQEKDKAFLATLYYKTGDYRTASRMFAELADAHSDSLVLARGAGHAFYMRGDYESAARYLDPFMDKLIESNYADTLMMRGMMYFHAGKPDDAIRILQLAVKANPNFPPAHAALGRVLGAVGREAEAKESIDRATQLHAQFTEHERRQLRLSAESNMLNEAYAEKRFDDCEILIDRMLSEAPDNLKVDLYAFAARVYQDQGKTAEAEVARQKAIQLQKSHER